MKNYRKCFFKQVALADSAFSRIFGNCSGIDSLVMNQAQEVFDKISNYPGIGITLKNTLMTFLKMNVNYLHRYSVKTSHNDAEQKLYANALHQINFIRGIVLRKEIICLPSLSLKEYLGIADKYNGVREVSPFSLRKSMKLDYFKSLINSDINITDQEVDGFIDKYFTIKELAEGIDGSMQLVKVLNLRLDLTQQEIDGIDDFSPGLYKFICGLLGEREHYLYVPNSLNKDEIDTDLFSYLSGIKYKEFIFDFMATHTHPFGLGYNALLSLVGSKIIVDEFLSQGVFHSIGVDLMALTQIGRIAPLLTVHGITIFDPMFVNSASKQQSLNNSYGNKIKKRNEIFDVASYLANMFNDKNNFVKYVWLSLKIHNFLHGDVTLDSLIDSMRKYRLSNDFIEGFKKVYSSMDSSLIRNHFGLNSFDYRELLALQKGSYLFFVSRKRLDKLNTQTKGELFRMNVDDAIEFIKLTGRYYRQKISINYGLDPMLGESSSSSLQVKRVPEEDSLLVVSLYHDLQQASSLLEARMLSKRIEGVLNAIITP